MSEQQEPKEDVFPPWKSERRDRSRYNTAWRAKRRTLQWLHSKGYRTMRLDNTWWWFLATSWPKAFLVVTKVRDWTNDEDNRRLKAIQTSKIQQVVLRWDLYAPTPRVGVVVDGVCREVLKHDLLPEVKE